VELREIIRERIRLKKLQQKEISCRYKNFDTALTKEIIK
jgi:hypothetical protein